jgi:hypothetical protein
VIDLSRYRFLFFIPASLWLSACTEIQPPVFDDPFPLSLPSGENVLGPRLTKSADGAVFLSWMRRDEQGATLRFSTLDAGKWRPAADVITDNDMFVNWADLPSVHQLDGSQRVAHWLSKSAAATYAYDVLLAFSTDAGRTWGEPIRPHTDGTPTEHGFVSIHPHGDAAALIWLDGRKTINSMTDDPGESGMTLRSGHVAPDGTLSHEQLVDDLVCDCCQTDVAVSAKGPIAVYRDRNVGEIRDIYVTRFADGRWQPGTAIADDGWQIAGCPVNGPAIDTDGEFVVVAWFTAANERTAVCAALSTNGGRTFRDPLEIASQNVSGHVGVAIVDRSSAAVSWVESDQRGTNAINIRAVTKSGNLGPVQTVGRTNLRRIYPQMLRKDDKLILVWTDERDERTRLASVKVPILGFYDR